MRLAGAGAGPRFEPAGREEVTRARAPPGAEVGEREAARGGGRAGPGHAGSRVGAGGPGAPGVRPPSGVRVASPESAEERGPAAPRTSRSHFRSLPRARLLSQRKCQQMDAKTMKTAGLGAIGTSGLRTRPGPMTECDASARTRLPACSGTGADGPPPGVCGRTGSFLGSSLRAEGGRLCISSPGEPGRFPAAEPLETLSPPSY